MRVALSEAECAFEKGEVPIGAVVVKNDTIIGRGHNMKERLNDPTAHAELIAITAAAHSIRDWRLNGAILYSTVEPCLMCAGAIIQSRLDMVVYGARDEKFGALGSVIDVCGSRWNWNFKTVSGVMKEEAVKLLKRFFEERRDG
ncbi:nucleoside deaminase [candidate division WOR-3 bacterium]|nr:nucleoside deaminase [candidate division WOR-3 bacterium]MCK4526377.1 nucleoside deaminase [candidate division WOR-3 bacterium]